MNQAATQAEDAYLQTLRNELLRLRRMACAIEMCIAAYRPAPTAATSMLIQAKPIVDLPEPGRPNPQPDFMSGKKIAPRGSVLTEERKALLRRDFPAGVSSDAIAEAFNALDGTKVSVTRISIMAASLDLRRPAGYRAQIHRRKGGIGVEVAPSPAASAIEVSVVAAPEPVRAPPAPVPAPAPTPAPVPRITRADAMAAASRAVEQRPQAVVAIGERVTADFDQVALKAGQWGVPFASWDDLPGVNGKAFRIGHPGFARKWGRR